MARIQTPQHVQELQAAFKIREPFGLELLETVQPTYALGIQKVASTGYPRKCFGRMSEGAGGVGTNIEVALRCPADIGIIILLTKLYFGDIGGNIEGRADDGVAITPISATSTQKQFRDTRINPAQLPDGIMEAADPLAAAPNGTVVARWSCPSGETVVADMDVVLGGGGYFLCRQLADNASLLINFEWTEFLLEDR